MKESIYDECARRAEERKVRQRTVDFLISAGVTLAVALALLLAVMSDAKAQDHTHKDHTIGLIDQAMPAFLDALEQLTLARQPDGSVLCVVPTNDPSLPPRRDACAFARSQFESAFWGADMMIRKLERARSILVQRGDVCAARRLINQPMIASRPLGALRHTVFMAYRINRANQNGIEPKYRLFNSMAFTLVGWGILDMASWHPADDAFTNGVICTN